MKFSIKDFFSKYDQILTFLWIWSHLLKKSLMKNFIFCAEKSAKLFMTLQGTHAHVNLQIKLWNIIYFEGGMHVKGLKKCCIPELLVRNASKTYVYLAFTYSFITEFPIIFI